ncbi:MAG: ATP-dependent sacrificial sulfur transferase LarE [Syntrophobacterales bacterium]|jgi:uncharacterized protein
MDRRFEKLKKILQDMGSVLVAFSGGVDSSFLLHVAHEMLGDQALAITFVSPFLSRNEKERASLFCKEKGIKHIILEADPLEVEQIRTNPPDRCYYCKKELYTRALEEARKIAAVHLIDGTQLSDDSDHRPGRRALKELKIRSPLAEAGLDKNQIRQFSRELGLSSWNLPPMACLASRIPYGTALDSESLSRIEAAEEFLQEEGFFLVRVRDHNKTARIELAFEEIERLSDTSLRNRLVSHFKSLGYVAVTVDLEGYRTGRLNELWQQQAGRSRVE